MAGMFLYNNGSFAIENQSMEWNGSLPNRVGYHGIVLHVTSLCVLMAAIVIGNLSLIVIIAVTPRLHTITNMFIVSLALSDLLVGAVVIPINLRKPTTLFYGYTTCMYAATCTIVVAISSMSNIFAVTIDRYINITSPLHYRAKMRPAVAMVIIMVTWVYSLLLGLLPVMGWRVTVSTCNRGETYPPYYTLLIFFSGCIMPVWGSGILYIKIFNLVRNHQDRIRRNNHWGLEHNESQVSFVSQNFPIKDMESRETNHRNLPSASTHACNWSRSNQKTIKTLAILMVYFEISWLPVFVTLIIDAFLTPRIIPPGLHLVFGTLAFVNSALDPVIYGYRNRDIRASCIKGVQRLCFVLKPQEASSRRVSFQLA